MIGFFPEIYPDELVLSVCSRYHERAGYQSRQSTGRDLFGIAGSKVAIDLPCNLNALVASFPLSGWQTVENLINGHTLLPFYVPFAPPERPQLLRADMRENRGGSIHARLGMLTSGIGGNYLRFCPLCVEDDRERFGETYWHRLHQVPSLEVCLVHRVFLANSDVQARNRSSGDAFITAEQAVCPGPSYPVDESNPDHRIHLGIARDVAWLLEQQDLVTESGREHRERYIGLLYERGYSSYYGPVNSRLLIKELTKYYSEELLEQLGCGLERNYNWVHRMIHYKARLQHPIQHLLLMQFLGVTASDFFRLPWDRKPFGQGPWPCLNRANNHYGQALITTYELLNQRKLDSPKSVFRCACGFAYYRVGPDESPEAKYVVGGVIATSRDWEVALVELHQEGHTRDELSAHFCVPLEDIETQLSLITMEAKLGADSPHLENAVSAESLKIKRDLWLKLREKYPELGRHALRMKDTYLSAWLRDNDWEWFEVNSPPRQISKGPGTYVNWSERDQKTEKAVREEAERIRRAPGRPIRVTRRRIALNIGTFSVLNKRGNLLPLAMEALLQVIESVEDCAVRRVWWAAECYRAEGLSASIWQLQARAAISKKVAKQPTVKAAIVAAAKSLDQKIFRPDKEDIENVANFIIPNFSAP